MPTNSVVVTNVALTKSAGAGGLGILISSALSNPEILALLLTGLIASSLSYFYDWVHSHPRSKGLMMLADFFKAVFYGIAIMFITYYVCTSHCSKYIDIPVTAWGFVGALSAGSAVVIVEWFAKIADRFAVKKVS